MPLGDAGWCMVKGKGQSSRLLGEISFLIAHVLDGEVFLGQLAGYPVGLHILLIKGTGSGGQPSL